MLRLIAAVAIATALSPLVLSSAKAETAMPVALKPEAHSFTDMPTLIEDLNAWLDAKTEWSQPKTAPSIRLVSEWQAAARQGHAASYQRGRLRGLYDPDRAEIMLVRPWNPRNIEDVSVLLHELVHHRQAPHHWYCPAAQELSAYRLQDEWLRERGKTAKVNWVAVVLDAGCTRRDIHPD